MDSNFRNKDTLKLFNETYSAKKEAIKNINEAKQRQKDFNNQLFNSGLNQAERINNNISNLRQVQRDNFRNKI